MLKRLRTYKLVTALVWFAIIPVFMCAYAFDEDMIKGMRPSKSIVVDGDQVEYFEESGKIVAEGNVCIKYGDVELKCDMIEVNTKSQQALCEGNVRIIQADGGELVGDRIRYDFAAKKGEVIGAGVDAFPWFGHAEETAKVGENEYVLKKGFVTTCDLDKPHYRLAAKEIRVFPNDKVIAKNVVAYVGGVPVLWVPYYYHPVIQSRAKVQFIPGVKSDWGYFLLSAWRFYIKGNTKVDVLFDYRSKKGFAGGANLYYNMADLGMEGLGEGIFRAYFIDQNGVGTYDPCAFRDNDSSEEWRNRFQWKHRVSLNPTTTAMLELNKMSDQYVMEDYFYNEYTETNPEPPNYLSVVSAQRNYTFSIYANARLNDFYTVTQRLPEVKVDIPDQRILDGIPLYYGGESSAAMFDKEYAHKSDPSERVGRLDSFHKFSYVTGIGPVSIVPYGTIRGTAYTRQKERSVTAGRVIVGSGVKTFARFHRIYDYNTDALGLDINGLRHIIVPSAEYFHTDEPNIDKDMLYQMDDVDALGKENGIRFALENKLQTKRHYANGLSSVDLVRFLVGVDYVFRMDKGHCFTMEDGGDFEDLNFDIELRPYDWFFVQGKMEILPQNQSVKTGSVESCLAVWKKMQLNLGYRYEKMTPDPRNQFTFDIIYRINPKWKIGVYERFNVQDTDIEEQQFSITRDLHCWEMELVYDIDGSNFLKDDFTFWVAFKIKAFPDLPIGLSRSFEKRPPGAIDNTIE